MEVCSCITEKELLSQLPCSMCNLDLPSDLANVWDQVVVGKVRDSFVKNGTRVIVASDRVSAFDVVLTTIPFKGQLLTEMAVHWFKLTKHIIDNHIVSQPHPNVLVCREADVLPVEVIVRGYLSGSAWRDYQSGRCISGIKLPSSMTRSQKFATPLLTPTTKAKKGQHDAPLSRDQILKEGIVDRSIWEEVEAKALELYSYGAAKALELGLILVDTKYEFGILQERGKSSCLVLVDEVHTLDSSRYWVSSTYEDRVCRGLDPEMLDKEFVRMELMSRGFSGEGVPPVLSDDFRIETARRYLDGFHKITGRSFQSKVGSIKEELIQVLRDCYTKL